VTKAKEGSLEGKEEIAPVVGIRLVSLGFIAQPPAFIALEGCIKNFFSRLLGRRNISCAIFAAQFILD